jgi:hypothetical protein
VEKLDQSGGGLAAEVEILRVRVANEFVLDDRYIDPAKWSPLIYNFRHYYRLAAPQSPAARRELGRTPALCVELRFTAHLCR